MSVPEVCVTPEFEEAISEVRKLAARGEFSAARKRVAEMAGNGIQGDVRQSLEKQAKTLEVLESVDVVRRLLRQGDTDDAARASNTILSALSTDEYARLGIVAAALSLLNRAGELARRVESGDDSFETREELDAFVDYLGSELTQLERESVDRPLEAVIDPDAGLRGSYTLGDMLSRRPWSSQSNLVEATPEERSSPDSISTRTQPAHFDAGTDRPVIGRILIEQEERERVSTAPQTETSGAGSGQDVFELVGRATVENWYIVAFSALIFAAFGYLATAAAPDRYESTALLQKTQQSKLRAPVTGETEEYVPALPSKTVLQLVKLESFHQRVALRLEQDGWAPGAEPSADELQKYPVKSETIAQALSVTVTDTGSLTYLIEFKAIHDDPKLAQAIAGASAAEFREVHYEHVTREATANLNDYEGRADRIQDDLDEIYEKRMEEFAITDVEAIGVDIRSRTLQLIADIHSSKQRLRQATSDSRATREELDTQVNIAARLPQYDQPEVDARIESRQEFLEELERELYELARKRDDFGEKHPIQEKITELQKDIDYIREEIKKLEESEPDLDAQTLNPVRAIAEDRVAKTRNRLTVAEDEVKYLEEHIPQLEAELGSLREAYLESESLRREEQDLLKARERTDVVIEELSAVKSSADRELALVSPAATAREIERETLVGIAIGLILGLVVGIGIAIGLLRRRQMLSRTA